MTVPTYDKFIEPLLRHLVVHPEGVLPRDAHEAVADALGLTNADREVLVPSGQQLVYKNRCSWAHDRLKRAGYSATPRRGLWVITPAGRSFLAEHPAPFSPELVDHIATSYMDVLLRKGEAGEVEHRQLSVSPESSSSASPDDRLELALSEIRASVAGDLLELLGRTSPSFFESIVLDVLHRMGYGASRAALQQVGGVGDGGIDGVISVDRLGLEKVYVQAKRWHSSVGRPEVQAFYGALAGQHANKGVMITTSTFTQQALEFAKSVERVVLVDGERLAQLMIEYEAGVSSKPVRIPRIDSDYFDE
jgi:restriction system protein